MSKIEKTAEITYSKNICIGKEAGIKLTNEELQLILKSKSIDIQETMTEREFYLIKSTIDCLIENGIINN